MPCKKNKMRVGKKFAEALEIEEPKKGCVKKVSKGFIQTAVKTKRK